MDRNDRYRRARRSNSVFNDDRIPRVRALVDDLADMVESLSEPDAREMLFDVVMDCVARIRGCLVTTSGSGHDPALEHTAVTPCPPPLKLLGIRPPHPKVGVAVDEIRASCTNPRLRLGEISHRVGLSPAYLDTLLKRDTGLGFTDHLRRARIALSEPRLADGNESIKAIALTVGFLHMSSFDRAFVRVHGCSPTQWRAQRRSA